MVAQKQDHSTAHHYFAVVVLHYSVGEDDYCSLVVSLHHSMFRYWSSVVVVYCCFVAAVCCCSVVVVFVYSVPVDSVVVVYSVVVVESKTQEATLLHCYSVVIETEVPMHLDLIQDSMSLLHSLSVRCPILLHFVKVEASSHFPILRRPSRLVVLARLIELSCSFSWVPVLQSSFPISSNRSVGRIEIRCLGRDRKMFRRASLFVAGR